MTEYELSQVIDDYITLPEVFKFYGVEINRSGFCCCPFHCEKTPSCRVNKTLYHCFGCGAKGNSLTFVEQIFNLDFKSAIQKLNYDFGMNALSEQITPEQLQKIRKRRALIQRAKQEELELENLKQEYLTAWKHYLWYQPKEEHYNINTPEHLVNEWCNSVDCRYIKAIETLARLKDIAIIHNFYMEKCDAEWLFLKL